MSFFIVGHHEVKDDSHFVAAAHFVVLEAHLRILLQLVLGNVEQIRFALLRPTQALLNEIRNIFFLKFVRAYFKLESCLLREWCELFSS